jgi:UDP-N-acetylmuramyl tripeptide synthase
MIGDHHLQNCLVAAGAGLAAGIDLATIARGIERVERVPGRLERARSPDSPRVYFDSCRTPTALAASLSALRSGAGRVWCVMDVPRAGDDDELFRFGHVLASMADAALIVTAEADDQQQNSHNLGHLIGGLGTAEHALTCRNRVQAIETALHKSATNDVVLLVSDRKRRPDDQQILREILRNRARGGARAAALFTADE